MNTKVDNENEIFFDHEESIVDYGEEVKTLIENEVKNSLAEEIRRAREEIVEENKKAICQLVEEHRQIITKIIESEKIAISGRIEELRKSVLRTGLS